MTKAYKPDIFTRLLYRFPAWCIKCLPLHLASWAGGCFADSKISGWFIPLFIRFFSIDTKAYSDSAELRRSLNTFFCRNIHPQLRSFTKENNLLLSPAEGYCYSHLLKGEADSLRVKGKQFEVASFLGCKSFYQSEECVRITVVYLTPRNYHRFHAPLRCKITRRPYRISGKLLSVNPLALKKFPDLYAVNERFVYPLEDEQGHSFQMVAVGATMVGSVVDTTSWRKGGVWLECGEEMGMFKFGGSTVVLITADEIDTEPQLSKVEKIEDAVAVAAGEKIATWRNSAEV